MTETRKYNQPDGTTEKDGDWLDRSTELIQKHTGPGEKYTKPAVAAIKPTSLQFGRNRREDQMTGCEDIGTLTESSHRYNLYQRII